MGPEVGGGGSYVKPEDFNAKRAQSKSREPFWVRIVTFKTLTDANGRMSYAADFKCAVDLGAEAKEYIAFLRSSDPTLPRCEEHLKELARNERSSLFLDLYRGKEIICNVDAAGRSRNDALRQAWTLTSDGKMWVWRKKEDFSHDTYRMAIEAMREHPVVLLRGPPGTGKSFFAAALILARMWHQRKTRVSNSSIAAGGRGTEKGTQLILVTAATHSAIDTMVEKLIGHMGTGTHVPRIVVRLSDAPGSGPAHHYLDVSSNTRTQTQKNITHLLERQRRLILCGTVWQLRKITKAIKGRATMVCVGEASLMPMIETSIALSFLRSQRKNGEVILFGDDHQLGNVIKVEGGERVELQMSLFNYLTANNGIDGRAEVPLTTLSLTWRLNKRICEFTNRAVGYPGYHPANHEVGNQTAHSSEATLESISKIITHKQNQELAIALLYMLHPSTTSQPTSLIMTPFHRKRIAYDTFHEQYLSRAPTLPERAMTIHHAQGKESDLAIVLLGEPDAEKIKEEEELLFDYRLLNVALTRARRRTIVIAAMENFRLIGMGVGKGCEKGFEVLMRLRRWASLEGCLVTVGGGEVEELMQAVQASSV
ncbi:Tripartite DNA replication factor [Rhizophlyctis rosea]|nr:Tripartite DNA replication factor [Rhizophlyctis rosea]